MHIAHKLLTHALLLSALLCAQSQAFAATYSSIEQATVRLMVHKRETIEYGSGTIVRLDGTQATIVSCGHLFEKGDRDVPVSVTLFTNHGQRRVAGRLVALDKDCDVSVLTASGVTDVAVIPMAPRGYRPSVGSPVTVAGCDLGAPVTSRQGHVTAINRCVGYENVEVSEVPVDGRSGGGMISADMRLIGICSGINPLEREGIYSSITCVHELLASNGATSSDTAAPPSNVPHHELVAQPAPRNRPAGTGRKPLDVVKRTTKPRAADHDLLDPQVSSPADSHESPIDATNPQQGSTEIICIIQPEDGSARRVVVIEDASPALLAELSRHEAHPAPAAQASHALSAVK